MFQVSEIHYGKLGGLRIFNDTLGSFLEICLRGGIVTAFAPSMNANILDGFRTEDEILTGSGARSWIMAPFSNKLKDNSFHFRGKSYTIPPPAIHGLIHDKIFEVNNIALSQDIASVALSYDGFCTGKIPEYPFLLKITVTYTIQPNKLTVSITGINEGSNPLPFGCGWHPYFFLPGTPLEKCCLSVPSVTIVKTDEKLLPVEGDFRENIRMQTGRDFSDSRTITERTIGNNMINFCYTDLTKSNGKIITTLYDPETERKITLSQQRGVVYVYTGDGLSLRPRQSIALEPVEFITNALNREEFLSEILILPGSQRTFSADVEYHSN